VRRTLTLYLFRALLGVAIAIPAFAQTTSNRPNDIGAISGGVPVITPPKLIHSVDVKFSEEARRKKIEGVAWVELVVDKNGMPDRVHITNSVADGQKPKLRKAAATLDAKAVEAVEQYRFQPAMRDGQPVAVEFNIDVHFHIVN
jgi:TonB family protein